MLALQELEREREKSYKAWFDRWWNREEVEKQIIIANKQGYIGKTFDLKNYNDYEKNRMRDEMFLEMAKEKLPKMEIYRDNKTIGYKLFGTEISNLKEKVIVKWA